MTDDQKQEASSQNAKMQVPTNQNPKAQALGGQRTGRPLTQAVPTVSGVSGVSTVSGDSSVSFVPTVSETYCLFKK